ncbi:DUF938 domain-containing protein [Methylomonas sp. LL1]|uniref:DUF938 domain-containing protein n=1 Tax=Methylomonas sp. LL1 TaxID=2785785 RepID=UPI0018C42BAD|nr:DUF938 domain-containing protein [Methylomonas sp. LL1]QPK63606.1 DUF938 domain-containing protein [Methylomonas sp. LL1]
MTIEKPFSQASENNKQAILEIIKEVFCQPTTVWEIGSGTGQHACHFAANLPHVRWQATDRQDNIPGIRLWLDQAQLSNLEPPLMLDVCDTAWPCRAIDGLFTANTLHIMSWDEVRILFERLDRYLRVGASVCFYGPFNYHGTYTSESNARFDQWLKSRNPLSGIRHFEDVVALASAIDLDLQADHAMPANNRLLVFKRGERKSC